MFNTNVELSKTEMELANSAEFILTKNRIIEKVYNLFGVLSEDYKNIIADYIDFLPAEIFTSSPKIYRGENYKNLPYVMLDHPRIFIKDDVFALRSFFWWGNYFSVALHISGRFLEQFRSNIMHNISAIKDDFFVGVNENAWEHHFEASNYQPLNKVESLNQILNKPFIKIAAKMPLDEWNNAAAFFNKNYNKLFGLIT